MAWLRFYCCSFSSRSAAMTLAAAWHDRGMTVVKINAITVPPEGGDELARRFAARAGAVDNQDGFEGFELLRPTDDRTTWLVVTRWRDEAAFQAWVRSPAFGHGHRQAAEAAAQAHAAASAHAHAGGPVGPHGDGGAGHGQGGHSEAGHGEGGHSEAGHGEGGQHGPASGHGAGQHGQHGPVAVSSELWSFEIAGGAPGAG
jgi:heme oxygenase (mycobilin-producing)